MSEENRVVHSVVVDTTPEMAFEALTAASELREWCSDEAHTEVRLGGRYEVRWNSGYRAEGKFIELDPPRRAAITWLGSGELGETRVEFTAEPVPEGTKVTIAHTGFGQGEVWQRTRTESDEGWGAGVENLRSVLETGIDLRLARQPFLGITFEYLTPERAEREGIDASYGIYVTGTVESGGAAAAGVKSGDVLVAIDGDETLTVVELTTALRKHRAGDVATLHLVRGRAHEAIPVTLASRPRPDLPDNLADLANHLAARMAEVDPQLQAAVAALTDDVAGRCPGEGEWSTKQILAHLSDGERAFHVVLLNLAVNGWWDAGPVTNEQSAGRLESILVVTPTLQGLLDRFLADERETVELVRRLPDVAVTHKARLRRIAEFALAAPDHVVEHVEQIKCCVEAVQAGGALPRQ